jgi:predicted nucleic-acid-binding Zn-ribbon protein
MKKQNICPKCGCELIFRVDGIKLTTLDDMTMSDAGAHPSVAPNPVHRLAAHICAECSFVELYATTPIVEDGQRVQLLGAATDPPPPNVLNAFQNLDSSLSTDMDFQDPSEITAITAIDGNTTASKMPDVAKVKMVVVDVGRSSAAIWQILAELEIPPVPADPDALVDGLPLVLDRLLAVDEAKQVKESLEEAGATVDMLPADS